MVRIFNSGPTPIKLVGASADEAAESVRLVGGTPTATAAPASPATTATGSPSAEPSGTASASAGPTASASAAPPAPPAGQATFSIEIPVDSYVLLVPGQGPYLQLTGLTAALEPGYVVPMRFTFEGGTVIDLRVPFGFRSPPAPGPSPEASATGDEHTVWACEPAVRRLRDTARSELASPAVRRLRDAARRARSELASPAVRRLRDSVVRAG